MSKVTNLRQFRKRKTRLEDERKATLNRVRFGRSKEERERAEEQNALEKRQLDQLRREIDEHKD